MTRRINLRDAGAGRQVGDLLRRVGDGVGGGGSGGGTGLAAADSPGGAGGDGLLSLMALIAEREMKLELSHPGSGRIYTHRFWVDAQGRLRKGGERPPHQASAPGEPPAVDTGQLRNSITHVIDGDVAYVGTPLAYGRHLEQGFVSAWGATVEPRPWMRPVVERLRETLPSTLAQVAGDAVRITVREGGR